tara:strand:- start:7984 stop:8199 length:216 start_codon:yes stop_codon:yes gene_type:complete
VTHFSKKQLNILKHTIYLIVMNSVLEKVPGNKEHAKIKAKHHASILKINLHKTDNLKSKIKKKVKPNLEVN